MIPFAKRNLMLYFRDRGTVFFSLLAVLIIFGLYVLFLGDTISSGLHELKNFRFLMDSWIMAGLLAVTSITTTLGASSVVVDDLSKGIAKDFHCSPLRRSAIVGGYVGSTITVGLIMSVIAFALAELYIVLNGGELLPFVAIGKVLGVIVLSVIASSSMVFFGVSFLRSQNAFGVVSTLIGTLIGFLTGVYVPISVLPNLVQVVIKVFPISHAAALFRQVFLEIPMVQAFGAAPVEAIAEFEKSMGVVFQIGEQTVSAQTSIALLVLTAVIFFAAGVWRMLEQKR